jgi:hypothetical protein
MKVFVASVFYICVLPVLFLIITGCTTDTGVAATSSSTTSLSTEYISDSIFVFLSDAFRIKSTDVDHEL